MPMLLSTLLRAAETYRIITIVVSNTTSSDYSYEIDSDFIDFFIEDAREEIRNFIGTVYLSTSDNSDLFTATVKNRNENANNSNGKNIEILCGLLGFLESGIKVNDKILIGWCDYRMLLRMLNQIGVVLSPTQYSNFYDLFFNCSNFKELTKRSAVLINEAAHTGKVECKVSLFLVLMRRLGFIVTSVSSIEVETHRSLFKQNPKKMVYEFTRGKNWIEMNIDTSVFSGHISITPSDDLFPTADFPLTPQTGKLGFLLAAAKHAGICSITVKSKVASHRPYIVSIVGYSSGRILNPKEHPLIY